jgi:hypothetical protein
MLKRFESAAGCLASTFGACTLVRRSVFRPLLPTEDVDFTTPLDAIAQGYRVVHEPGAVVFEYTHAGITHQFRARRRMVAKNLPGTLRKFAILRNKPLIVGAIVSHKLLRWTTPALLATVAIANATVAPADRRYQALLRAQALFYLSGAAGFAGIASGRHLPIASSVSSYLVANAGFAAGLVAAVRRTSITTWEPLRGATSLA